MYKGHSDWSYIAEIKNHPDIHIPIFGNGDIDSPEKAVEYKEKYGVDGIMIGRAAIGNPWIFNQIKHFLNTGEHLPEPSMADRVATTKKHLDFSIRWKGDKTGVYEMRRHYSNYFKGLQHFKPYRQQLVELEDHDALFGLLDEIGNKFQYSDEALS